MRSILGSDGYKFSMAEAGAALREETFYYSHRHGGHRGWHYMPVDVSEYIKNVLPTSGTAHDYSYLSAHAYEVGAAFRKAFTLTDKLKVNAVPKGAWFYNREPAFTVRGASAIGSWLEPTILTLNYRIQLATAIMVSPNNPITQLIATCDEERDIILETFDSLGKRHPKVAVQSSEYYDHVYKRAMGLVEIVKNPDRIFEVGMRAVSCSGQHRIALEAIKAAGIMRTSNVALAEALGMTPVGTMGHEHIQRYGDDYESYIAMRDRFPGFLFYLPDTFNALRSGIPSALKVIAEQPERDAGIRFDSEKNIRGQYTFTVASALEMGLRPRLALESSWNATLTAEFEKLREQVQWEADRQAYGYGGYLVKPDWKTFLRDDVSAVWKLCQTGSRATMKFGDEPDGGKQSLPGRPVIVRPNPMYTMEKGVPVGFIAQEGEDWAPPVPSTIINGSELKGLDPVSTSATKLVMSPATLQLIEDCKRQREEAIARAAARK